MGQRLAIAAAAALGAWLLTETLVRAQERLEPHLVRPMVNQSVAGGPAWLGAGDVMALIEIESNFRPRALRWEPHLGEASMGLTQILLSTARDRGFTGTPAELFDPERNIAFGVAHLVWTRDYLADRGGAQSRDEWISAYNTGVGAAMKGRRNLHYVHRFNQARARYG